MAEHVWSILCEKTIVDSITNNVSLDVVEQIQVEYAEGEAPPMGSLIPMRLVLASLWLRDDPSTPETVEIRLSALSPTREQMGRTSISVDLTQHVRGRSFVNLPGFFFKGPGTYRFLVEVKRTSGWAQVANLPLDLTVRLQETADQAAKALH